MPPRNEHESGANPSRFIRQPNFQWSELIDLLDNMQYEKMRGSHEAFGALQDKLEELDAQHQFHGKDLPLVLDELERAGALPSLIHRVGTSLANLCARRDPEGTADAVVQDDRIGNWRLGFALEVLGKQNPERALEWFEEHLDDGSLDPKGASDAKLVEDSMGSLLAGVAQSDLGSAIDYLMESPERTAKRGIYRLAFVLQTPEQQREVLELTADNKALQTHTVAAFARSKIESQSADAAWEFLTHLPVDRSAEDINTIMIDILNREINRDMHLAPDIASWLGRNSEAFASDGTHRKVLQNALSKWKVVDMDQATAWEEDHSNLIK